VSTKSISSIINKAIKDRIFPGCVIGIIDEPEGKREILTFGRFKYGRNSEQITPHSIFDVASITKVIPTSSLALTLIDRNIINIDEKVSHWIPEMSGKYKNEITLFHLLTHTLHYNFSLSSLKQNRPEIILNKIFSAELQSPPGKKFFYCNTTSILLGLIIERILNKKLYELASEYFFKPLVMNNTKFWNEGYLKKKTVPTEIDSWRQRIIQGEVHDESAWVLSRIMTAGSAGLFSTAEDLLIFLKMLLNNGIYNNKRYFTKELLDLIAENQIAEIEECTGLGWELNQRRYMGNTCSKKTIGKTGFTGCVIICDLEKKKGLVLLSNYTWPQRKRNASAINAVRKSIAEIVFM
jgi:CubicO group peptidase (beta-lactamase class C family)